MADSNESELGDAEMAAQGTGLDKGGAAAGGGSDQQPFPQQIIGNNPDRPAQINFSFAAPRKVKLKAVAV